MDKPKFQYAVRNLRHVATILENERFESGDLQACVTQLTEIITLIKGAMQYVGEK